MVRKDFVKRRGSENVKNKQIYAAKNITRDKSGASPKEIPDISSSTNIRHPFLRQQIFVTTFLRQHNFVTTFLRSQNFVSSFLRLQIFVIVNIRLRISLYQDKQI